LPVVIVLVLLIFLLFNFSTESLIIGGISGFFAGSLRSFFEYDSQPRGLSVRPGWKLDIEDASGQLIEGIPFGVTQYLWINRIVYFRNGKVIKVPIEAFCISPGEIQLKALGRD